MFVTHRPSLFVFPLTERGRGARTEHGGGLFVGSEAAHLDRERVQCGDARARCEPRERGERTLRRVRERAAEGRERGGEYTRGEYYT